MEERDYHAQLTLYGLNKKVSSQRVVKWLKEIIEMLEEEPCQISKVSYKDRLMK
jgi:hypothetical protein